MYRIRKEFEWEAAHQLTKVPKGHKCRNFHGHSYRAEIIVKAEELDERGFVVDFGELDPMKQYIDNVLDHQFLNDVFNYETTAENIAFHLFERMQYFLGGVDCTNDPQVERVRVWETRKCYAEYKEECVDLSKFIIDSSSISFIPINKL